jgi:hypothetical protein
MNKILIKMIDGGLVDYDDDSYSFGGCPTCDYGSSYITEINMTLTKYKVHIKTNQMYEYVLSEGDMLKILLSNYEEITTMTEKEFTDWMKVKLLEIASEDELEEYSVDEL